MRYIQPTKKTVGDRLAEISGGYSPGTAVNDVVAGLRAKEQNERIKQNILRFRKFKGGNNVSNQH